MLVSGRLINLSISSSTSPRVVEGWIRKLMVVLGKGHVTCPNFDA